MSKAKQIVRWSVIPLSVLLLLGMLLAGCGSKSSSISDILKKSEEAGKNITSMRQEVQLVYEHPTYGTGTVQSRVIEISGNNVHVTEVVFGATIAEKVLVSGRQFSKTYPDNKWVEETPTLNPSTSMPSDTSQYTNLVSNSQSQEQLANETVNGYDCFHLRFQLSADNVKNMVSQVPQESLAKNTGGTVDIWIDQANYYMIKSEGYFKGVNITSLGEVNLKVIISRTSINQPISIVAPI
jgi:hypothetical protein